MPTKTSPRKSVSIRGTTYERIHDYLQGPFNDTGVTSVSGFVEMLIDHKLSGTKHPEVLNTEVRALEATLQDAVKGNPKLSFVSFQRQGPYGGVLTVLVEEDGSFHRLQEAVEESTSPLERDVLLKEKLLARVKTLVAMAVGEEDSFEDLPSECAEDTWEDPAQELHEFDEVPKVAVTSEEPKEEAQEEKEGHPSFVDVENGYVPPVLLL